MSKVTISPKYQVVIPKEVRQETHLKKGQKMIVLVKNGIISLIPEKPIEALRGFAKGMDMQNIREKKDRA